MWLLVEDSRVPMSRDLPDQGLAIILCFLELTALVGKHVRF